MAGRQQFKDMGIADDDYEIVHDGNKGTHAVTRCGERISEANKTLVASAVRLANLPKINTNSAAEVADRCNEYFNICIEVGLKPSTAGLALALGTDRMNLHRWMRGVSGTNKEKKSQEIVDILYKAKAVLNSLMEDYMQTGKINPVSGIFLLKNNFEGYQDKSEIVLTPNQVMGDTVSKESLEQKYLDSIPDVDESL